MSSQFSRLQMLFAFILGIVITSTYGDTEYFERELFDNALKSMIENPLKNESYQTAYLLYANEIETENYERIWEISVVLNSYNGQQSEYPSKKCNLYVKGENFTNINTNVHVNCSVIEGQNGLNEEQYTSGTHTNMFKSILCENFLPILLKNSLKDQVYTGIGLIRAEPIVPKNGDQVTYEVSVVLENYLVQQCQEKRCDIYFKQDKFNKLTAYNAPEQCRCIFNGNGSHAEQDTVIGVPMRPFFGDPEINHLMQKSNGKHSSENRNAIISTPIINATEMNIENGKKYEINYNVIENGYEFLGITKDYTKNIILSVKQCKIEAIYKDTCGDKLIVDQNV